MDFSLFPITRKRTGKPMKWVAILIILTLWFFLDDFLLVYIFKETRLFQLSNWLYNVLWILFFIASVGLAFAVYSVLRKKATTGLEGLLGQSGYVINQKGKSLTVTVHGEIWQAESVDSLQVGDRVQVEAIHGLKMAVRACKS